MTAGAGSAVVRPSPVFFALVAATVLLGGALWRGADPLGIGVFSFVLVGWVVSLTLHEFGHAVVAYAAGDRSVVDKGYLTLDVRHYVDPGTSLLFPLLILVVGGIGLPGGAVWIDMGAIRSATSRSLVSAAGPAATALCGLLCLLPLRFGWLDGADPRFLAAIGFLGAIQVIALLLNLIPIPGLDGFGILEPHLSQETLRALGPVRAYGFLVLFVALWAIEPVGDLFWGVTDDLSRAIGGDDIVFWRADGWRRFRFWE